MFASFPFPFLPLSFPLPSPVLFLLGSQANVVSNVMCSVDEEVELIDRRWCLSSRECSTLFAILIVAINANAIGQRQKSRVRPTPGSAQC